MQLQDAVISRKGNIRALRLGIRRVPGVLSQCRGDTISLMPLNAERSVCTDETIVCSDLTWLDGVRRLLAFGRCCLVVFGTAVKHACPCCHLQEEVKQRSEAVGSWVA